MSTEYRNFLALPYEELEELNLAAKPNAPAAFPRTRFARRGSSTDRRKADQGRHLLFSDLEGVCTCSITTRNFSSRV